MSALPGELPGSRDTSTWRVKITMLDDGERLLPAAGRVTQSDSADSSPMLRARASERLPRPGPRRGGRSANAVPAPRVNASGSFASGK